MLNSDDMKRKLVLKKKEKTNKLTIERTNRRELRLEALMRDNAENDALHKQQEKNS